MGGFFVFAKKENVMPTSKEENERIWEAIQRLEDHKKILSNRKSMENRRIQLHRPMEHKVIPKSVFSEFISMRN